MKTRRSLLAALCLASLALAACMSNYDALSPVAVFVPADQVWSAARYFASLRPHTSVVKGEGYGMLPLYRPGTVLVIEARDYNRLKAGMTVMFKDHKGERVVHYLVQPMDAGWETVGLSQGANDRYPMTSDNYLGVVIMAFTPRTVPPAVKNS